MENIINNFLYFDEAKEQESTFKQYNSSSIKKQMNKSINNGNAIETKINSSSLYEEYEDS